MFHNHKNSKDGKGYRCKPCDYEARKNYRDSNQERFKQIARTKQLKFKYGLTPQQYETILSKQDHLCAICKCDAKSKKVKGSFAVDHNHDTGRIRGLLCNQCNRALGLFEDSPEMLQKAFQYLKEMETH